MKQEKIKSKPANIVDESIRIKQLRHYMQQLIVFFCIFSWNISKDSQLLSNLAFTKQIWRTKLAQLHPEIPGNYIHFLRTSRWLQAQLKAYNVILTEAACTFCLKRHIMTVHELVSYVVYEPTHCLGWLVTHVYKRQLAGFLHLK